MKQRSFAASEFAKKPKQTRREKFLLEMDAIAPWSRLLSVIEPHYPKAGNGRRPYELSTMLRIHFMQQWFGYADAAMEEAFTKCLCCGTLPDWMPARTRCPTKPPS